MTSVNEIVEKIGHCEGNFPAAQQKDLLYDCPESLKEVLDTFREDYIEEISKQYARVLEEEGFLIPRDEYISAVVSIKAFKKANEIFNKGYPICSESSKKLKGSAKALDVNQADFKLVAIVPKKRIEGFPEEYKIQAVVMALQLDPKQYAMHPYLSAVCSAHIALELDGYRGKENPLSTSQIYGFIKYINELKYPLLKTTEEDWDPKNGIFQLIKGTETEQPSLVMACYFSVDDSSKGSKILLEALTYSDFL